MSDLEEKDFSEKQKEEIIEELKNEWNIYDIVNFNEFNIQDKLREHAFQYARFSEQLNHEKFQLNKLKEMKEVLEGQLYHHYRFEMDETLQKGEIEKYYLPKDPKMRKMNKILRNQEIRVKFFEICTNAIDKVGWNMKNFLETMKRF